MFVNIGGCLKIKEIHQTASSQIDDSNLVPSEIHSVFPASVETTVTRNPSWQIIIKNSDGETLSNITPQVSYLATSFPAPLINQVITCSPSDPQGISNCTSSMPVYTPGSTEVTVQVGNWSKSLTVNNICPTDWNNEEMISNAFNIMSVTSLIDTPEKFELIRCNQSGGKYYVKGIDFSQALAPFRPIYLQNDVNLEFFGDIENLSINNDDAEPLPPSLFEATSVSGIISGLTLKNLSLKNFNYLNKNVKEHFGVIAGIITDSVITDLKVSNFSWDQLADQGPISNMGLFAEISNSMVDRILIDNVKINIPSTSSIVNLAMFSGTLKNVSISNGAFSNIFLRTISGESVGILAGTYLNADRESLFEKITINNSYILYSESQFPIGGLIGVISDLDNGNPHTLIQDVTVQDLYITGSNFCGGLIGKASSPLNFEKINSSTILSCNYVGGIVGQFNIQAASSSITWANVAMNNTDYLSGWSWAESNWQFQLSSYSSRLTQEDYANYILESGGIASKISFYGENLEVDKLRINLNLTGTGSIAGIAPTIQNTLGESSSFSIENLELFAEISGDGVFSSLFNNMKDESSLNFNLSSSLIRAPNNSSISFTEFLGADLTATLKPNMSINNLYIHTDQPERDCHLYVEDQQVPQLRTCVNTTFATFQNVRFALDPGTFFEPAVGTFGVLNLDFDTIWDSATGSTPVKLKNF